MRTRQYLFALSTLFICLFILLKSSFSLAQDCPNTGLGNLSSTSYKWRGDRCEGMIPHPISGQPELVSLSANGQDFNRNTASIEVKSLSVEAPDIVKIQAFLSQEDYLLDRISRLNDTSFRWNRREVLEPVGISQQQLRGISQRDGITLPIVIGGSPPNGFERYKFILRSNSELTFPKVEILEAQTHLSIYRWASRDTQPRGDTVFLWNGRKLDAQIASQGQYIFKYDAYEVENGSRAKLFSGSILFEHDPSWLSP